ncbi:abhydrolase domain-containing [Trichoderma arundinaceum]|uniref:Abhydrolase domain-containing n=1 Tax=Trichoderma arundinaceum TaxID=490622 RepID=A0A395N8C4_TRIAR|nr:abhydrolase domain-containing [Trichoderma arundinaceum]
MSAALQQPPKILFCFRTAAKLLHDAVINQSINIARSGKIPATTMSEGPGAEEEDWTEVPSAASRRRLQNRLNQRASRRRKKELQQQQQQQQEKGQFSKWVVYVDPRARERQQQKNPKQRRANLIQAESTDTGEGSDSDKAVVSRNNYNTGLPDIFLSKKQRDETFRFFCSMNMEDRRVFFRRLYELVTRNVAQHTLDSQLLLSVMQFNVIRAAATNSLLIGVSMEAMAEDVVSPFCVNGILPALPPAPSSYETTGDGNELGHIPPNLRPTALQRQVIHHPWIDICPQPSLRDAILRRLLHDLDEEEFCHHLFLQSGRSDEDGMIGMVVWGEASDPASYEISATMVQKWPWILQECPDILMTTNYWRKKRQEKPLEIL